MGNTENKFEQYNIGERSQGKQIGEMRDYIEQTGFGDKNIKIEYKNEYGLSPEDFAEFIKAINQLSADQRQQLIEPMQKLHLAQTENEKQSLCQKIKDRLVNFGIDVAASLTAAAIWAIKNKMFVV